MANNFLGRYSLATPKVLLNYTSYTFNYNDDPLDIQHIIYGHNKPSGNDRDGDILYYSSDINYISYNDYIDKTVYITHYENAYGNANAIVEEYSTNITQNSFEYYLFNNKYYSIPHSAENKYIFNITNDSPITINRYTISKPTSFNYKTTIPVVCKLDNLSYFQKNNITLKYNTFDNYNNYDKSYTSKLYKDDILVTQENIISCVFTNDNEFYYHGAQTSLKFTAYTYDEENFLMYSNINYNISKLYGDKSGNLNTDSNVFSTYGNTTLSDDNILFSYITLDTANIKFDYIKDYDLNTIFKLNLTVYSPDDSTIDYTYYPGGKINFYNIYYPGYGYNYRFHLGTTTFDTLYITDTSNYIKGKSYIDVFLNYADTDNLFRGKLPNMYKTSVNDEWKKLYAWNDENNGDGYPNVADNRVRIFADSTKTFNLYIKYIK